MLITNARVVDGTGNPWFYGDLAIKGDRIAAVVPRRTIDAAEEVIDASRLVVCPGFIDIQSHSIVPFLTDRRSLSKITQGVTTEILGEDWTPAPFGGRIDAPFAPGVRRRVGETFAAPDTEQVLVLTHATEGSADGGTGPDGRVRKQFSLFFTGPLDRAVPQGVVRLEHGDLGELGLFLVPLGPQEELMRYEAAFS